MSPVFGPPSSAPACARLTVFRLQHVFQVTVHLIQRFELGLEERNNPQSGAFAGTHYGALPPFPQAKATRPLVRHRPHELVHKLIGSSKGRDFGSVPGSKLRAVA
ncbi:hypothetical protein CS8_034040 [Cupriavidus sp. 8B]